MTRGFVPPYLLERLAAGRRTRAIDDAMRERRSARPERAAPTAAAWEVHTAGNTDRLPGDLVRSAGRPASGDDAVDEAATGIEATLALYADLGRRSYDGRGAGVLATVHYEKDYDNAFWNGTQLVFGDGDGQVFGRFTKPIDVLGHELSHALTEHTAGLRYADQPGALNESISDVFGACVKQRSLAQTAAEADWLVGEGIFLPGVHGEALRSMKDPGTAYDDPRLGKDPQVGHLRDYVHTSEDNGGVHTNSGIPNKAFYLAASAIGGPSWEGAGRIWFAALTSGIGSDTDFAGFAAACLASAGPHADEVRSAWQQVGVEPGGSSTTAGSTSKGGQLRVVRSGGFAGIRREGSVDLSAGDERAAEALRLLERTDFSGLAAESPGADRFQYSFEAPDCPACTVGEDALTPELRRLAELALGD